MADQSKKVFVLMPLRDEFDDVYLVIRDAAQEGSRTLGIEIDCLRADEIAKPGRITEQIIQSLKDADLLIADLSGNNPNVMYELGYGHALEKPALIINQEVHASPFDVKDFRQIVYDRNRLMKDCRPALLAALCDVFGGGDAHEVGPVGGELPSGDTEVPPTEPRGAARTPLRPGSAVVAELQTIHLKLQFANSKHNIREARTAAGEALDVLSRITVASAADDDDIKNTAATAGNCAVELERTELFSEAEQIYRRALGLFPDYPGLHVQYGDYLVDMGRYDEAAEELRRARQLNPEDARISRVEMKIALKTGAGTPAMAEQVKQTFEQKPGDRIAAAAYLMYLSKTNAPMSVFEDACRKWKEAAPPEQKVDAERALADHLASSEDSEHEARATQMYEDLLSGSKLDLHDRHAILHNLATLYARVGSRDSARACWVQAYELDANDATVRAAFSQRLAEWGEMEAAMAVVNGQPLPEQEP
jgi:tetratricopeptide (TPR) repeat protein